MNLTGQLGENIVSDRLGRGTPGFLTNKRFNFTIQALFRGGALFRRPRVDFRRLESIGTAGWLLVVVATLGVAFHSSCVAAPPSDEFPAKVKAAVSKEVKSATREAKSLRPARQMRVLPSSKMADRIDVLLSSHWQRNEIQRAAPATDAEFLRRVYLDLTGRIPSVSEVYDFDDDAQPKRRLRLVDQLLNHRDHATHLAANWRRFLLPDGVDLSSFGGSSGLEQWLADRFAANIPYDQIVRELIQAEGRVTKSGPIVFYAALNLKPEEIASQAGRAFLGMRTECAQCHDHPFDEGWSQDDFWGYAAFFARISRPKGKLENVSTVMRVRDSQRGEVTLPDSEEIVPPRFPDGERWNELTRSKSRRHEFAQWLTERNNEQFARATVNRVWSQVFGLGIVEPVDDMRPDNPPVCPEVLDELTRYFIDTEFDLQNLIRTLVVTDAYQLSSRTAVADPKRGRHFAQMNIKSFTAEQLYDCIAMATRMQMSQPMPGGGEGLRRFANTSRRAFLDQFRAPPGQPTEYHAGIPQALTLMNGGLINNATDIAKSGLLNSLPPFFNDKQRIDTLFLSTLSRYPSDQERILMLDFLTAANKKEEKQMTLGNILWALLNSAEFTLNH